MSEAEANDSAENSSDSTDSSVTPVGVKLGSTRTVLSHPDDDNDIRNIQSLTCLALYEDAITGDERVLYGEEAAVQYPDEAEYMLRSGLPEDDDRAELASRFFKRFVEANDVPSDSVVVYAIPTIDNEKGIANLEEVIDDSPIGEKLVRSYPESLCGAIPAFGDGLDAIDQIFLTVNMGSTNLEVSAYRRGEQIVPYSTGGVTGNEVDRDIVSNIEEETQGRVKVDRTTAREYKEAHADFDDFEPFTDVIQQPGGGSHEFTIERSVMDACNKYLDEVVDTVANEFLPLLANDYMKVYQLSLSKPIVLTGGMACIPGIAEEFEARLSDAIQREIGVISPDEPDIAAATGAQRIADYLVTNEAY